MELAYERLIELLHYDPETGHFTWKINKAARARAGQRAGNISQHMRKQYRKIRIDGVLLFEHRLAFLYMTGKWPECEVDHIDQDGLNNRWQNLRPADKSQNGANRGPQSNSKSGVKGVFLRIDTGRFQAAINVKGKRISLGCYDTIEEARQAYRDAAIALFDAFAHFG